MSKHKDLLSCWHKLEHFSPATTPNSKNLEVLDEIEPWKLSYKPSKQNKTFEYTVYLGVFNAIAVNDFVKTFFEDTKKDETFRDSKICFASLKLDIDGKYIDESIGISTLPWALSQLERDKIKSDYWEKDFEEIKKEIKDYIDIAFKQKITNSNNEITEVSTVINKEQLFKLQSKIELLLGWSLKPKKDIRIKREEKFKNQKENNISTTDILNSFYIKDLEKIISKYNTNPKPKAFQDYIEGCLGNQSKRINLSKEVEELRNNLTPRNYPDGRWASDFTLSLMQQYAVNNIFNDLSEKSKEGLFSVNGPPGTGKTTLLRDIIAPIMVKKAKELCKIDNPSDAFRKVGEIKLKDSTYSPFIYKPQNTITSFGIVVSSSNNGAVENISKELPLKKEVSKLYGDEIEYFKSVAENCVSEENWGILSAVLGNKKNRAEFINTLWFDFKNNRKIGLQKSLNENKLYDNSEWNTIKKIFHSKLKQVNEEKNRLEKIIEDSKEYSSTKKILEQVIQNLGDIEKGFKTLNKNYLNQKKIIQELLNNKKEVIQELSIIKSSKPSFFTYWFNKSKRITYKKALNSSLNTYNEITEKITRGNLNLEKIGAERNQIELLLKRKKDEKLTLTKKLVFLNPKIQKAKSELKNNYADEVFWENIESQISQTSCPWYSDKLKELQSELFIISLKLNEIFLLTANAESSRISTTLSGFFEYLKGGTEPTKEEIKAMWDTFFLVIPVISSTFASIQTMFKDLDKEDIPWLFIDEAGQAIPQAAAGVIWRSKRVAIVGDPFQIEPVVTIPNSITDNISNYFDLNKTQVSPELSVQSMADRINPLGSYLTINDKKEWIGIPLRVHRRCINPMFEIANSIAYDNTMFCSTSKPKMISVNFKTSFIDCKGTVDGRHFVNEQAIMIKDILTNEIMLTKDLPNIFVITPFSEVSFKLKKVLGSLLNEVNKFRSVNNSEMREWLNKHIGTVHTFQGKQAEGVILCLGLDDKTKGAANWASKKPNLLNVALTRAKYRFIAIGDKDIWLKQPYFNELKILLN